MMVPILTHVSVIFPLKHMNTSLELVAFSFCPAFFWGCRWDITNNMKKLIKDAAFAINL